MKTMACVLTLCGGVGLPEHSVDPVGASSVDGSRIAVQEGRVNKEIKKFEKKYKSNKSKKKSNIQFLMIHKKSKS